MDVETKLELIRRVGEEIITEQELEVLLETKDHPIAYDGFEPSGLAHVPFGIYRAINLEDLIEAGIRFKLLIADWHAWINDKMDGYWTGSDCPDGWAEFSSDAGYDTTTWTTI